MTVGGSNDVGEETIGAGDGIMNCVEEEKWRAVSNGCVG
jgi:hypothetical protein